MKYPLHFVHGNGFPSPCYRQLLERLQTRFDCYYIDKVGHDAAFPVADSWQGLVDEVILSIKKGSNQPVVALGHSLGGVLSVMAAVQEPALFKTVIILDSPLIGRFKSSLVRLSKQVGLIDHLTPAFRTRKRRTHWDCREQVLAYLKTKSLFKHFTAACLEDYVDFGLQHDETGYTLRFDSEIEYQIYRTIPHTLSQYEGRLQVPTVLIYGNQSRVVDRHDRLYMNKHYGITSIETQGTHMFPMEHPDVVADLIFTITGVMSC